MENQYIGEYVGQWRGEGDGVYAVKVKEGGAVLGVRDAQRAGNAMRFMNHSCSPNVRIDIFRVNDNIPRIACVTTRRIEKGEELRFDYGVEDLGFVCFEC